MHMIREATKVDCALRAQTGGTGYTGEWFRMDTFAKAHFTCFVTGQNPADDGTFLVYEATDATGSDESQLGATITMSQGSKVTLGTVSPTSTTVGRTLIITPYYFNGEGTLTAGTALTYTAAAAQNLSAREFINTDDDAAATSLAACINDATYGVPGVLASASSNDVTLSCTEPGGGDRQVGTADNGTAAFDVTESNAELVVQDLIQMADFEVYVQDLDRDNDFTHVGARVAGFETDATVWIVLERAMAGYGPVGQAVTATDTSA